MNNYENRIVLFLDILGFKKIIEDSMDKENEYASKTSFLIQTLHEMIKVAELTSMDTTKNVTQFSDSIVISFKEDDSKEIPKLFHNLCRLISNLLAREILCRGAISYGKLYHKENLIFGPALVDAYETESQAALYPRIILDKSVLDIMGFHYSLKNTHNYRKIRFESDIESYLKKDTDDKFYIDYFAGSMMFYEGEAMFSVYGSLRKMIINGMRFKNPSINIKYCWMKNKYNMLPKTLEIVNTNEELFYKRPDIKKFYDDFKEI